VATRDDTRLAVVAGAQLATGISGLAVAVRRKRAYDFLGVHGDPAHVARDAVWMGTALSAPAPMLVAQTWALWRVARRGSRVDRVERAVLGALGAAMVGGYLGESLVRRRLSRAGWDRVESPIAATGLVLAAAMAALWFVDRQRFSARSAPPAAYQPDMPWAPAPGGVELEHR
jgi:ABC-type Mn2+/Zn2+ transport system permease subunit